MTTYDKTGERIVTLTHEHTDDTVAFMGAYRELARAARGIDFDDDGVSVDPRRVFVSRGLFETWAGRCETETERMLLVSMGPKVSDDLSGLDVRLLDGWLTTPKETCHAV